MNHNSKLLLCLEWLALIVILCLAGYVRILNQGTYPGLYNDEGTQINIAMNYLRGQTEYLGIRGSLLLAMRMPIFPFLLSILFRIFGVSLEVVRSFSAALGLLTIALLYVCGKSIFGAKGAAVGLLAALALAISPKVVMFNRLGISYNLLAPLVLLHFWGLCKYWQSHKRSWLVLAALAMGLGWLVDLVAFTLLPAFVVLAVWWKRPRRWLELVLAGLPFALYAVVSLISAPSAFLFDLGFAFQRTSESAFLEQIIQLIMNFGVLILQDPWFLLGLAGLFLIRPLPVRWIALLVFLPPAMLIARAASLRIGFYYLVPWMPILSIGLGMFILQAAAAIHQTFQPKIEELAGRLKWAPAARVRQFGVALVTAGVFFLLVMAPILMSVGFLYIQVSTQAPHQVANYFDEIPEARQVQSYIHQHIRADEVVLASPALAWMLDGRPSDYQIALAAGGQPTLHLPSIPAGRLAFALGFETARYIIVDAIWVDWAEIAMPELMDIRLQLEASGHRVLQAGRFSVYENPAPAP